MTPSLLAARAWLIRRALERHAREYAERHGAPWLVPAPPRAR